MCSFPSRNTDTDVYLIRSSVSGTDRSISPRDSASLCIVDNGGAILRTCSAADGEDPKDDTEQWEIWEDDTIRPRNAPQKCLGAIVTGGNHYGFNYLGAPLQIGPCLCRDCQGWSIKPKPQGHQVWHYDDSDGKIKSGAHGNLCITVDNVQEWKVLKVGHCDSAKTWKIPPASQGSLPVTRPNIEYLTPATLSADGEGVVKRVTGFEKTMGPFTLTYMTTTHTCGATCEFFPAGKYPGVLVTAEARTCLPGLCGNPSVEVYASASIYLTTKIDSISVAMEGGITWKVSAIGIDIEFHIFFGASYSVGIPTGTFAMFAGFKLKIGPVSIKVTATFEWDFPSPLPFPRSADGMKIAVEICAFWICGSVSFPLWGGDGKEGPSGAMSLVEQ